MKDEENQEWVREYVDGYLHEPENEEEVAAFEAIAVAVLSPLSWDENTDVG